MTYDDYKKCSCYSDVNIEQLMSENFVCYLKVYFLIALRLLVSLPDGYFYAYPSRPAGWTHVLLNSKDGEGIRIYINGEEVESYTNKRSSSHAAGDGRIVVGRYDAYHDDYYTSVHVDELIYFNAALTTDDVQSIYNSA